MRFVNFPPVCFWSVIDLSRNFLKRMHCPQLQPSLADRCVPGAVRGLGRAILQHWHAQQQLPDEGLRWQRSGNPRPLRPDVGCSASQGHRQRRRRHQVWGEEMRCSSFKFLVKRSNCDEHFHCFPFCVTPNFPLVNLLNVMCMWMLEKGGWGQSIGCRQDTDHEWAGLA